MHEFIHAVPKVHHHRLSEMGCEAIKAKAKIDDKPSPFFTIGNAYWFQFWAHQGLDSMGAGTFRLNRYNGLQDGEGVYPARRDSALLNRDGSFRLSPAGGLPTLRFQGEDHNNPVELAQDSHRVNENPVLSAFHLLLNKLHNRLLKEFDDFDLAQARCIALMNRISLNESLILCDMDEDEFFGDVRIPNFHRAAEFNFAVARWAHPMMRENVNGRPLFEPMPSHKVDMHALFDGTDMARDLNLGVSNAMLSMHHLPGDNPSILDRTFARHQEMGLACWHDLCAAHGFLEDMDTEQRQDHGHADPWELCEYGTPIFAGMLLEAEANGGRPGAVLRRALADGLQGSLRWGETQGQGLWLPLWNGAPKTTLEIIDYALG